MPITRQQKKTQQIGIIRGIVERTFRFVDEILGEEIGDKKTNVMKAPNMSNSLCDEIKNKGALDENTDYDESKINYKKIHGKDLFSHKDYPVELLLPEKLPLR